MAIRRKPAANKAAPKRPAAGRSRGTPKKKGRSISVDFTGVETRTLLPEGEYHLVVEEVTEEEGSGDYSYLKWKFKTIHSQPALNNKAVYNNTSLSPNALWNLRNLLEALGVQTPDSAYDLDLDSVEGAEMVGSIEHDVYEDDDGNEKTRQQLVDYMPLSADFEESTGGVVDDEEEDEEEDKEDDDEDDEEESDDEEEAEESDDEETISEEEVQDMNAEDLAELVEAYELKVDFGGMRSLRKKQNAVVDALKEEGYIDE